MKGRQIEEPQACQFVKYTLLKTEAAWRRLPPTERKKGRAEFAAVIESYSSKIKTYSYSTVGLKAQGDLLLWQVTSALGALQESTAQLLQTRLGCYLETNYSLLGLIRPSHYVKRQTEQEQALSEPERLRYLIVYPFVKTTDWYLIDREARQAMMNEHIKVGHQYPMVQQLLAYSFGLDDQEFIVAYETDDLQAFLDLVHALRMTQGRKYTLRDTPILTGIHRPIREILRLLGAPVVQEVRS